jgi:glycerophosphoryl diester phosphodiesterase
MITVAHRAGNSVGALREALAAGVDLVEADVHLYRGRQELRHGKWLGPWHLWDRGGPPVRRREVEIPLLGDVLAVAGPRSAGRLMLDLKGVHPGLAPAVAAALRTAAPGATTWICTQHWWMLPRFTADPQVRLVLSAGSRRGVRRLLATLRRERAPVGGRPAAGVSVRRDLLTPAVVAELHERVPLVLTWPVDTGAELTDARRLGVSGVISRNLPLLRTLTRPGTGPA